MRHSLCFRCSLSCAGWFPVRWRDRVPAAFWVGSVAFGPEHLEGLFGRTSWNRSGWGINAFQCFGASVPAQGHRLLPTRGAAQSGRSRSLSAGTRREIRRWGSLFNQPWRPYPIRYASLSLRTTGFAPLWHREFNSLDASFPHAPFGAQSVFQVRLTALRITT